MTSGGGAFFDQFIEDYFAECDEHLATVRRVLLALEEGAAGEAPDPRLSRDLLRGLHTLKGLSGMVGDARAERVAHALEDAVRAGERAGAPPARPTLDALFAGVDLLERCIAAHRAGAAPPPVDATVAALARVGRGLPDGAPAAATPDAPASSGADDAPAGVLHRFEFTPSLELTSRGVGVDVIRDRLRGIGTVLEAKPRLVDGGVAFDFSVVVAPGHAPEPAWTADGLRWSAATPAVDTAPIAPDATARPATGVSAGAGSGVVRVDLGRLDGVMRLVGDLVVSRTRFDDVLRQARAGDAPDVRATLDALEETNAAIERQLRRLRESVMRIRLVPIGEVFERLRFAARDAIRESGRRVRIVVEGQDTEIDKLVVDRMLEPLLHLVRNAVSHGIETPSERTARGKPAEGTLTLRAIASGDRILVDVEDDGAGIDVERVAARARARGLLAPGEALAPDALLDLLCAPGFSTREEADRTSGRGVGMDVVRSTVRALAGDLRLETRPGRGTRFAIELPLTLMILDALMVEVGGQLMAVPQPVLREILQLDASAVVAFENNDVVPYRGGVLPLMSLARLFDLPQPRRPGFHALVVGTEAAPIGLVVDRLRGLREIVVHPVTDPLVALPGISGATELGDGRVSLILDVAALLRLGDERRDRRAWGNVPVGGNGSGDASVHHLSA